MFMSKVLTALVLSLASASTAVAGIYDELTPAQQQAVQKGEQVFLTQEMPNSAWPKAYVFQRVDATPEQAAAVFSDFERGKDFIPNVKKSQISQRLSPSVLNVDYLLNVPMLKDESYTVQNTVSSYAGGAAYQVQWKMVRADSTKDIVGSIRFESLGTGSVMAYVNFVTPGSGMAGMVKKQAMKQVRDTAQAIADQAHKNRVENPALMDQQVQALREMLKK